MRYKWQEERDCEALDGSSLVDSGQIIQYQLIVGRKKKGKSQIKSL